MRRAVFVVAATLAALLLVACGGDDGPPPDDDEPGMIRGLAPHEFYQSNCASCHGAQRDGVIGPALLPETLTEDDETYARIIRDGVPRSPMPAWGRQLSDEQIDLLVEYLRTEP